MNSVRFIQTEQNETKDEERLQRSPKNLFNWKMYSIVKSSPQETVVLQHKYSYLLYTRKNKLQNACPADIRMLKDITDVGQDDLDLKTAHTYSDIDFEEHEDELGEYTKEPDQLESRKLNTWDEYKKLVELAQSEPQIRKKSSLTHITSLPRVQVYKEQIRSQPRKNARAKKSIIKMETKRIVLIADCNHVQFRNFKLNKLYKKTVTLQNVSTSPAKFQIDPRPYHSNFRVIIKRTEGNRNIIPPGMQFQLIILFRCNEVDEPEELLVLKVERGKPLFIRLHGYKEPPILIGTFLPTKQSIDILQSNAKWLVQLWDPDSSSSNNSTYQSEESETYSIESWETIHNKFISMTFDCGMGFVGETVYMSIRLENIGGSGRFFVMSEAAWTSMYIQDITDQNILKLSRFTVCPAYFRMKSKENMTLHTTFSPESYGVHVDKLYILCNNCTILATEIIGDGVIFEPNFIQINKKLKQDRSMIDFDGCANYRINLTTNAPNIFAQCTITVTNTSEIGMYFRWEKRDLRSDGKKINDCNYFPPKFLLIQPDRGIFHPTSVHHFTVIAEYSNLQPNLYFALLQLYVEDVPEMAVSKKLQSRVQQCTNRRRDCSNSVDIWIDDVEVWLKYTMDDEIKSDQAFDDIAGRITGRTSNYKDLIQDDYEEIECEKDDEEYKSSSQLLIDELFAHYDIMDLKQFEPLLWEYVITTGIIKPSRTLYIGVEETCVLTIKNLSNNGLMYSWGEVNGQDAEKLKVCVCPEKGEVSGQTSEKFEIILTPIKEGVVQSLYMPCFIGDSRKIIMLSIECYIEPLYVTFYFPLSDKEPVKLKNNFIQVQWRMDSFQLALDLAGMNQKGMKLLEKYRAREEQELMTANLDQGDVLKDASAGPSFSEVAAEDSGEEFTLSARTSEIIQMSNLVTGNGKYSEEKNLSSGDIVPFFQTTLPSAQQPVVVIEFLNLPLKTVEKKTFIIKNETPIPTNFQLDLKNFYPIICSCKGMSLKGRIKSIYKKVHCRRKSLIEETMCQVKQPKSGIVIYVDPVNSNIGSFEAIPVNIYVYGDTWGIYVDKLEINITGLPLYTLEICVQVVGSPVSLSISNKNQSKVPVIKYGTIMKGSRLQERKIIVWNTGIIPIAIDWHLFITKPLVEKMPFNVVFDICTSFTDKLASELRARKLESINKIPIEHEKCCSKLENSTGTSIDSDNITAHTYSGSSYMAISWESNSESLHSTESSLDYTSQSITETSKSIPQRVKAKEIAYLDTNDHGIDQKEAEDTEFKVSILPYYGPIDANAGTVAPREMFLLPNNYAFLTINIHSDKIKRSYEGELLYKILGFLRIAPSDKYRDNYYFRQDGNYLHPIEIDVTANVMEPKLIFNIPKTNRTFMCCAHDVMQSKGKRLELVQTFFLHNQKPAAIHVMFETYDPFHVKSIATDVETNLCKLTGTICIKSKGCAEVEVVCVIDEKFIETITHTSKSQYTYDSVITITEPLQIIYTDKQLQNIELILKVWMPILKLSSYALNFGLVYVGDTKKLMLNITNMSIYAQSIKLNTKLKNNDFILDQTDGTLAGYSDNKSSCFMLTVSFQPKKPGQSVEILQIVTDVPYNTEECEIYGEGTLDEKYHSPGV